MMAKGGKKKAEVKEFSLFFLTYYLHSHFPHTTQKQNFLTFFAMENKNYMKNDDEEFKKGLTCLYLL